MSGILVSRGAFGNLTLQSAVVQSDGVTWILSYNRPMTGSTGNTVSMSGGPCTLSYVSGQGTDQVTYTGSRTVFSGETGTLDYTPGNISTANGSRPLKEFSDFPISNSSLESEVSPPVVASQTASHSNSTVSFLAVDKPSGVAAGDLLIANIVNGSARTVSLAGWTQASTVLDSILSSGRMTTLYKIAGTNEPSSYTFQFSNVCVCGIVLLRVIDAANPSANAVEATTNSGNNNPGVSPSITPSDDDSLVLRFAYTFRDNGDITATPTTELFKFADGIYNHAGSHQYSDSSATGTANFTLSREWVTTTIALAPSGIGGGGDTTPPVFESFSLAANGVTLTGVPSEDLLNAEDGGVALSASGGAVSLTHSSGYIWTTSRTILNTETLTASYTPGTITDLAGNAMASFSGLDVDNNSTQTGADVTPPTIVSKTINSLGTTLTVVFNEGVTNVSNPTISPSGGAATVVYSSGSGTTTLVYSISRTILFGETITLSGSAGFVEDIAGNDIASVSGVSVTNNSTQGTGGTGKPVLRGAVTQVVSNGASFSYTPVLVNGTGVTYTFSGLPAWASGNASTGEITGTAATGRSLVTIIAANSFGTSSARVNIHAFSGTTSTDSSFLAANGPSPYTLGTANHRYQLAADITVDKEAFLVAANNIVLDLNGHNIFYDNAAQPTFNNTGFETAGTPSSVAANWDFANGPNFVRVPRTQYGMWGDFTLAVSGFVGTQYILSDTITVPDEPRRWRGGIFQKGTSAVDSVDFSIVDAANPDTVLATSNNTPTDTEGTPDRGFPSLADWQRAAGQPTQVKIKIAVTLASGQNVTLDFAFLRRADVMGIWAAGSITDAPIQMTSRFAGALLNKGNGFTLIDSVGGGSITQMGRSFRSHAVNARAVSCDISGVEISVNGMHTAGVEILNASTGTVVEDVAFTGDAETVPRRMSVFGMVDGNAASNGITIRRNSLTGLGFVGIYVAKVTNLAQSNHIEDVLIEENIFDNWYALGTDGYCISCSGVKNSTIRRNKGIVANGRGILLDGFGSSSSQNVVIGAADHTDTDQMNDWWGDPDAPANPSTSALGDGNFFRVKERANLEYDRLGMEATALRLRYFAAFGSTQSWHVNIKVNGNYFWAETTKAPDTSLDLDKWDWAAVAARVTMLGEATVRCYDMHGNVFKAICVEKDPVLTGAKPSSALAYCFQDALNPTNLNTYEDNVYESNDAAIVMGDNDTSGTDIGIHTLVSSTIIKSADGDATMGFESYRVGDWGALAGDLRMYSTTYSGGATEAVAWGGPADASPAAGWTVRFGDRVTVVAQEPDTDPISGATVTVDNNQAVEVFSGTTDANGSTGPQNIDRVTWVHNGTSPSSTNHNPIDIEASKTGYVTNSDLNYTLAGDATRTIQLTPV